MENDCKRMTVHAIGVDEDGNITHAKNYNYNQCTEEVGNCGCTHAEAALVTKMVKNPRIVVVTHSPCLKCAEILVDAGVQAVYFIKGYRKTDGIVYLVNNGVKVQYLTEDGAKGYALKEEDR